MSSIYRGTQVDAPSSDLHLVERPLPEPPPGHVRVTIQASAICHSDSMFVQGHMPGASFPMVPGHEIAGHIAAIGDGIRQFSVGQRVAIGWFGGNCGHCVACREGGAINCEHLQVDPGPVLSRRFR